MTEDEANIEAAKREKNKSKFLNHKRWKAVYDESKGWGVRLEDSPHHVVNETKNKTKEAFFSGNFESFIAAAGEHLIARCAATIDDYETKYGKPEIPQTKI